VSVCRYEIWPFTQKSLQARENRKGKHEKKNDGTRQPDDLFSISIHFIQSDFLFFYCHAFLFNKFNKTIFTVKTQECS
jgi:hypothetical protein